MPLSKILRLEKRIISCRKCPRLVKYREEVARTKRHQYQNWEYWGRPLPGFGDPGARSGDWLYRALYRFQFANQPASEHRGDGLTLQDCYITAIVRCAPPQNKPSLQEQIDCRPYLLEEIQLLNKVRVVIALGQMAFAGFLKARKELRLPLRTPLPRFAHGARTDFGDRVTLLGSYHPSQQNTFTGRLTTTMFHKIFATARQILLP